MFKVKLIKDGLSPDICDFLFSYLKFKKDIFEYISPLPYEGLNKTFGKFNDPQIPNTFSIYSDHAMETILLQMIPTISKNINLPLLPSHSYTRLYKKGDELKKHTDRDSCEITASINLGGDSWPIYVDDEKFNLSKGDILVYKGNELNHWREPFEGNECAQVFLHYILANSRFAKTNIFDKRKKLGIPN